MITDLWGLRSTNNGTEKRIYVKMRNNEVAEEATLVFDVCAKQYEKVVQLEAGSEEETSIVHDQEGNCVVAARDDKSGNSTQKALDLNAPGSG